MVWLIAPPIDNKRHELANWITNVDFGDQQAAAFSRRTEGTGEWFLKAPKFVEWIEGKIKDLWCPGHGKDFLHYLREGSHTYHRQLESGKPLFRESGE